MKTIPQCELRTKIISGDEVALKYFYTTNLPLVKKHILRYHGKEVDAEDIFQDAMLFVYQKLKDDKFQLSSSIAAYFHGVCKNLWRNQLRKNKSYNINESIVLDQPENTEDFIDTFIIEDKSKIFLKYFDQLTNSQKRILNLFIEGYSMRDIANKMGYTEKYTRQKKYQAKKSLMDMIKNDEIYQEIAC